MSLFWQSNRLMSTEASFTAKRSELKAEEAHDHLRRLESRVNQLTLVNMAMWSLLKERAGLTEEDLLSRVQEIDMRDGKLDGRLTEESNICPHCDRTFSKRHDRCLYCGYEREDVDAFGYPLRKNTASTEP